VSISEEAVGDLHGRQMSGFKDFYQFVAPTRVVAGRGLIEGLGFEFSKEGAKRVAIVTDEVIRATGLIDKVEAGIADGGLEVAAVYDGVPPDSDAAVVVAAAEQAKAATRFWPWAAGRSWTPPRRPT
jgi:alcohol dehydrogenase YqhD (iron-dependent ADH family)